MTKRVRLINAWDLIEYCNNQKSKTIDNNDIARFPTYKSTDEWHYIKDKDCPKCNELVIALDCKNEYAVLYYEDLKERGGTSWHTVERFTYARNIIAWQYLPEPPKEM